MGHFKKYGYLPDAISSSLAWRTELISIQHVKFRKNLKGRQTHPCQNESSFQH